MLLNKDVIIIIIIIIIIINHVKANLKKSLDKSLKSG